MVRATITDAANANVFVNASGRNSLPSAATIVKTGRETNDSCRHGGQYSTGNFVATPKDNVPSIFVRIGFVQMLQECFRTE